MHRNFKEAPGREKSMIGFEATNPNESNRNEICYAYKFEKGIKTQSTNEAELPRKKRQKLKRSVRGMGFNTQVEIADNFSEECST